MGKRRCGVTVGLLGVLLAGACSSAPAGPGGSTGPSGSGSIPATPTASPSASTSGPGPTPAAAPLGHCGLISLAAATDILGTTPRQLPAAGTPPVGEDGGVRITKLDGCSYSADPSLGYDVLTVEGAGSPVTLVGAARGRLAALAGAKEFAVGLGDASLGFTAAVGAKTMARIEVAKGTTEIAVAVTATDAVKAQSVALEAARRLVAAVG